MNRFQHSAAHRGKILQFIRSPSFREGHACDSNRNSNTEFQSQKSTHNSPRNVYNIIPQLSDTTSDSETTESNESTESTSNFTPPKVIKKLRLKRVVKDGFTSYEIIPLEMYSEEKSKSTQENNESPPMQSKVANQKSFLAVPDPVPARIRSSPVNLAYTTSKARIERDIQMKQYRERVIHLLVLKEYKKIHLLTRLQKDGWKKCNRFSLGKILDEVANLNTSNNSYNLKECIFKEIKRDWPGYNDNDRKLLDLVLSNKPGLKDIETTAHRESSVGHHSDYVLPSYQPLPLPPSMVLSDVDGPLTDFERSLIFLPYASEHSGYVSLSILPPQHAVSSNDLTENSTESASNMAESPETEELSSVRENMDTSDMDKK
ncbi:uncharacterized protein RHO17_003634 [Thomomys bottae]